MAMNIRKKWPLTLVACCWLSVAMAQLEVVRDEQPQFAFSGGQRRVGVSLRNIGTNAVHAELRIRLLQTTSATAVQIADAPWKKLQVPGGQTIIESAALNLPNVKAKTRFIVQWWENTNKVIGMTDVMAYPTNLLEGLKPLLGDEGVLGVLDPPDHFKPLLKYAKVEFVDLENTVLEDFRGRLAIIGPFESKEQMCEGFSARIQTIARKGVAVVWIQPRLEQQDKPLPSFYSVPQNEVAVVVVQPELVADLAQNPRSQLNLIHFCRLALHTEPLRLPNLKPQP